MEKWYSDSLSDLNAMKKKVMLNMYVRDAFFNMISSRPKRTETADMFEMLLYSQAFQEETSINCRKLLAEAFDNPEKFLAKDWYILSQYCYTYLKSCYRARCIGLGLLERNPQKEEVRWETDKQNCINYEVSKAMVNFKAANKTNRGNVYGFLPADNELYLSEFDNSSLLAWIDKFNIEKVSSILQALPEDFCFSSGMGAWATHFHINTDGTFEGQYHDTNMGEIGDGYLNWKRGLYPGFMHLWMPRKLKIFHIMGFIM